jgi:hypothetical protein
MTRLFIGGVLVEVQIDLNAMPVRFTWEGQVYRVQNIANHWRVDMGWWRLRICRDYFKVSTSNGLLVTLYRDLLTDCWYLQRVYD